MATVLERRGTGLQQNVLLAGVGGQGILTIAEAISGAAIRRGLQVKQAEVHGMAQRGGGVHSHLRFAESEIHSDLIPAGEADVLISVEPLECLRYLHYLKEGGAVVAGINAFANIANYPPIESLLDRLSELPRHVLIDAERIARAAGSGRAANIAILGAASPFVALDPAELQDALAQMFQRKGADIVAANLRAFRFGRNAGQAYLDGLGRGGRSIAVRHWIDTLDAGHLSAPAPPDAPAFDVEVTDDRLSGAEAHAVERTLERAYDEGRPLFEHEVYSVLQFVGAIAPPHHVFVSTEETIADDALARFAGDHVVLKIVSPDIVHKTDANGIAFVRKDPDTVRVEIARLIERHRPAADVRGVLVVEFVERVRPGLGDELFVGVRATREFGPVIAAGLGGVDTEYLATAMRPGLAVAKAPVLDTTPERFLDLFRATVAYDILSGHARGRQRMVSDGELLRCFRAFMLLARRFCVDRGDAGPDVAELEVNPFTFRQQRLVPLDGRGRLATAARQAPARPIDKIDRLLEPRSVAVLGVSADEQNVGRIILQNVLACGFPKAAVRIVKPGTASTIDGVRCYPSIDSLPAPVDLLVIAASARQLPAIVDETIDSGIVQSAILIPGGVGETEGSGDIAGVVRNAIARSRRRPDGGPVFLGPNSLGAISRPGGYDTLFIPSNRLDKRWQAPGRPVAIVSQSGAFIVSRMSNLEVLDPRFAISLGNQMDLTAADVVRVIARRSDIQTIGIYVEGFNDLDGLSLLRDIESARRAGKNIVFYKAGRTESGRSAAAGHTAAIAGDYDVCQSAAAQAGALVADTFKEFEQMLELCTALGDKTVRGVRIGAVSNAGFECVGIADAIRGQRYRVQMAQLGAGSLAKLADVISTSGLSRLVSAQNPLDLTPMAAETAYEGAIDMLIESDDVDAVIVGIVPLTSALLTAPEDVRDPRSLAVRLPRLFATSTKPMVAVVDSGPRYAPFVRALREGGVPVFPSADQAVRSLGRYLCDKAERPVEVPIGGTGL